MTLQDFVNTYNGKIVRGGQCGELIRQYWIDVDKTNPPSYPNSKDYWFNPVPGYDKVANPQPGDIAIYNGHGAYPEGHSAIYYDGRVFEQNADPDGSPAHLFNRNNTYLLGYLRKQGVNMADKIDVTTSRIISNGILARNGITGRAYSLDGSAGDPWVGGELTNKFLNDVFNSPEAKNWRDSNDPSSIKDINAKLASIPVLQSQIDDLKKQLANAPTSGGLTPEQATQLSETNSITKQIWAKLTSIFK